MKIKQEVIENFKAHDVEWLAEKLYECRAELEKARKEARRNAIAQLTVKEVKRENENLARVLQKNGIRPTLLRLTYYYKDCEGCPYGLNEIDGTKCTYEENVYNPREENCQWGSAVSVDTYYLYDITDGYFEGISGEFNNEGWDIIKAVDERTGDVIYEREREDDETT